MDVRLSKLQAVALHDETLKARLFESKNATDPMQAFCDIAREYGVELTPFELASLGEESCAMMLRSQNGGGEIEPMGWSDDYELFFLSLGVK